MAEKCGERNLRSCSHLLHWALGPWQLLEALGTAWGTELKILVLKVALDILIYLSCLSKSIHPFHPIHAAYSLFPDHTSSPGLASFIPQATCQTGSALFKP